MSHKEPEGSPPDVSFFAIVSPRTRAIGRRNRPCRITYSEQQRSFPFLSQATDLSESSASEGVSYSSGRPQREEAPVEVSTATKLSRPTPANESPTARLEGPQAFGASDESCPSEVSRTLSHTLESTVVAAPLHAVTCEGVGATSEAGMNPSTAGRHGCRILDNSPSPTGQHAAQPPRWTIELCRKLLTGLRGLRDAAKGPKDSA